MRIAEALRAVTSSGKFAVSGQFNPIHPGLRIQGIGDIALPLLDQQAEALINVCEQAPYGRGEETIVDTSVRNVWQMNPEWATFTNPEWEVAIRQTSSEIAREMGLGDSIIDCQLYKILLYGPGSFFKRHRDTEKTPNMFATMIVNLPSAHEGGELVVSHAGDSKSHSFAGDSRLYPEYATFYADCYHEVKPVQSGYRFALVYNLAIAKRPSQPTFTQHLSTSAKVDQEVARWAKGESSSPLLVYLLEHSYTPRNLRLDNLKNDDYARAAVLMQSAERNNCKAFLCLATYHRQSYGDCFAPTWGEPEEEEFEEWDINEEEVYAHQLRDREGLESAVRKISLTEEEIYTAIPLHEGPGRDVEISEATGNEGATKDLWYHRGAVIVWPSRRHVEVVLRGDIGFIIENLHQSVRRGEFAEAKILAQVAIQNTRTLWSEELTQSLLLIEDGELLNTFLRSISRYGLPKPEIVAQMIDSCGLELFEKVLNEIVEQNFTRSRFLSWADELLVLTKAAQSVKEFITQWVDRSWNGLLNACYESSSEQQLTHFIRILSLRGDATYAEKLIAEIETVASRDFVANRLRFAILQIFRLPSADLIEPEMLERFGLAYVKLADQHHPHPPVKPTSFARDGKISCDCPFCEQVNDFLPDPNVGSLEIKQTLKRNIQHVADNIAEQALDVEVTICKSKHKFDGKFEKNQRSYERAFADYTNVLGARRDIESSLEAFQATQR